ncbi:9485_t:CDS:2 [Gigaspora margarita]|uniref:9485_t:CDS:1 n=1 Tax=Gigaspora margarita TaxID=4874 RepID=A0ABN7W4K1_GIGMA|nr:9485_t:CDS:2 [Gigaspora margarita]
MTKETFTIAPTAKSRPASTLRNSDQQKHTRGSMKNAPSKRNNKYRCEEKIRTSRP